MIRSHIGRYLAPGRTYCVDATAGADTNSGNAAAPLQTLAAVNALALKPGDRVLFKRGETWTGTTLVVPASGKPGQPITFAAYGTGAQPILDITNTADGVLTCAKDYINIQNLCLKGGTARTVLVWSHDVLVEDCTVIGNGTSAADGIRVFGLPTVCYRVTVRRCDVSACNCVALGGGGIMTSTNPGNFGPDFVVIENNTAHGNGTDVLNHHGVYVMRPLSSCIVRGNICYSNIGGGMKIKGDVAGMDVYGNACYSNGCGIWIDEMSAGKVHNNLVYGNSQYAGIYICSTCTGGLIYHNTVANNNQTGIYFASVGLAGFTVKNNLFFNDYNVVGDGMEVIRVFDDVDVTTNNVFDYNLGYYANHAGEATVMYRRINTLSKMTFAQWQAIGGDPSGVSAAPVFADATIRAATTVDADSAAGQTVLNTAATAGFVVGEIVCIAPLVPARTEFKRIASIQDGVSLTMTANLSYAHTALQADGVTSLVYTDYHLQTTSPAKNAGEDLGIVQDYDQNVRPYTGTALDIGAYEFQGA